MEEQIKLYYTISGNPKTICCYLVCEYWWKTTQCSFYHQIHNRYAKRPRIPEASITDYDSKLKTISFRYKNKYTNTYQTKTISATKFIGRLIRHIPEKNFRMIRYYGIYANAVKNSLWDLLTYQISQLFSIAKILFQPKKIATSWHDRIIDSTSVNPLICKKCNNKIQLAEIGYRVRDGTLRKFILSFK